MSNLSEKYEELRRFIKEKGEDGAAIALSGGVDSTTLAAICHKVLGEKAVAVTAKSSTYPANEMKEAQNIAREIGIRHYVVESGELSNENFVRNPEDHCYYCKADLLGCIQALEKRLGFKVIFEGTNFSDLTGHRPGFRAIEERKNVFSPWVENEFTKEEIRVLAQKLGLSVHDKPSLACLASRIPFGERITEERLERVGKAEQFIKDATGIRQLRVRDHDGLARIEVGREERKLLHDTAIMDKIAEELKHLGFKFATIDMEGYRTGSMLITAENTKHPHYQT